jgi:hypothetical protein
MKVEVAVFWFVTQCGVVVGYCDHTFGGPTACIFTLKIPTTSLHFIASQKAGT